jgi:hypothetical protein
MLWLAGSLVPVCQAKRNFFDFALAAVGLFDSFSPSEVCEVAIRTGILYFIVCLKIGVRLVTSSLVELRS